LTCEYQGDQQYTIMRGDKRFEVPIFGWDYLSFKGGTLLPVRDAGGKVTGLEYDGERVANLRLARLE
ncbi:MAG: hypothetical protein AAFN92_02540, partial [Bacteroidota bacterium]